MSVLGLVAVMAAITWSIGRQWRGTRIDFKAMVQLPAGSIALTAWLIFHHAGPLATIGMANWIYLGSGILIALVLGAARGATVGFYLKDGQPAVRYRAWTALLWLVLGALGVTCAWLAADAGASLASGTRAVMLMFSLSELAELGAIAVRKMTRPLPPAARRARVEEATAGRRLSATVKL